MSRSHSVTLFLAISAGSAALLFNAMSIVQGDLGLIGLTPGGIDQRFVAAIERSPSAADSETSR